MASYIIYIIGMTLYDMLISKRTHREFERRPVPRKLLENAVNAARLAPQAGVGVDRRLIGQLRDGARLHALDDVWLGLPEAPEEVERAAIGDQALVPIVGAQIGRASCRERV